MDGKWTETHIASNILGYEREKVSGTPSLSPLTLMMNLWLSQVGFKSMYCLPLPFLLLLIKKDSTIFSVRPFLTLSGLLRQRSWRFTDNLLGGESH